jgi:GDPmannose 4,6-dehydratase
VVSGRRGSAIIFGASGQDGRYLCALLRERGMRTIGVARSSGDWTRGDVRDRGFVEDIIRSTAPTHIFQLAANSTTTHAALFENHDTIATGALAVLEAASRHAPDAKVFIAGSGLQFANTGAPIKETDEFDVGSAYALARVESVYAARYFRRLGLKAYVGYLFHHDSPLRRGQYVSKQVIEGLKRIRQGETDVLAVADQTVRREWVFAEDVARGMLALVDQESAFEATIGSGEARSIAQWIQACAAVLLLDEREFSVVEEPEFVPPFSVLVSDPSTMRSLGWKPRVGFEELAATMVHAH